MYSGKLEFKHEHQANLLAVAKVFNIPILTKLLSAQVNQFRFLQIEKKNVASIDYYSFNKGDYIS